MAETDSTPEDELVNLRNERARLFKGLLARNTQNGYRYDFQGFIAWCEKVKASAVPASTETISLYVTDQLLRGSKIATVRRRLAALTHVHRCLNHPPPVTSEILNLLKGARRLSMEQPRQVAPLTLDNVRTISLLLTAEDTGLAFRNRALLVAGFGSALRSSNLASLKLADLEFTEKGLLLRIRRSKTDQEGKGALVGLPHGKHPETCPVRCLLSWIERRGSFPGPVFTRFDGHPPRDRALQPERISQVVQELVARIGLDPTKYGGHSLRAGLITALAEAGASDLTISRQSLHRDMATLRRYVRPMDVFRNNPCELLDF